MKYYNLKLFELALKSLKLQILIIILYFFINICIHVIVVLAIKTSMSSPLRAMISTFCNVCHPPVTLGDYIGPKKSSKNHLYWPNNWLRKNWFIYVYRIDTWIDFYYNNNFSYEVWNLGHQFLKYFMLK